jgi:hypothetical protein
MTSRHPLRHQVRLGHLEYQEAPEARDHRGLLYIRRRVIIITGIAGTAGTAGAVIVLAHPLDFPNLPGLVRTAGTQPRHQWHLNLLV